jgi:hypothetical protein
MEIFVADQYVQFVADDIHCDYGVVLLRIVLIRQIGGSSLKLKL